MVVCAAYLVAGAAFPCGADDKNGVSPKTISLPSGPGSIEGLGGSFQPMLNTGMASYEVKIAVPAGVNGHGPQLSLRYNSGSGHGIAGIGWEVGAGSIKRQTEKGIPRYVDGPNGINDDHDGEIDEPDEVDRMVGPDGEELVKVTATSYRARIEGSFILYEKVGDHWVAHLKDGGMLEFGVTPSARVTDKTGQKTYAWLLEKSTDTNGNAITFSYTTFPNSDNQKYLKEIRYGPGGGPWTAYYFVSFTYEDRPDWRKDYRSGFLIKTAMRLARIDVGIEGSTPPDLTVGDFNQNGTPDALIRRYALTYDDNHPYLSFLYQVTQYGADGTNYLPPITFSYATFDPSPIVSATGSIIGSVNEPPYVMDNPSLELVDLNGDGLPDILRTESGGVHTGYVNRGVQETGGSPELTWDDGQEVGWEGTPFVQQGLAESEVHLADMNGDGISDFVYTHPFENIVYYYQNRKSLMWGPQQYMSLQNISPPAPFTNPDVEVSDLDFDKRIDVIKSTEYGYSTWFNLGNGVYSDEVITQEASHNGYPILFSDYRVHLADMNGDRMNDVVKITGLEVTYCANAGHGRFEPAVEIPLSDWWLDDEHIQKARLEDVNGDGLSDLVVERAIGDELWYWLNRGTDSFSDRHVINGMPPVYGMELATRWADMNGNGTTDLVYADSDASPKLRVIDIGKLVGGSDHPNVLTGIDNGLGVSISIIYKNSTDYYLTARDEGTPWNLTTPFPVSVVGSVETTTGLDLDDVPGEDSYLKDFIYRDSFYDDNEKAFRGFSEAKVLEYGDPSYPTLVTVHDFHTGGPDGIDNDGDGAIDEISQDWFREEDALKGLSLRSDTKTEDGILFSRETNFWGVQTLLSGVDGVEVRFAYNQESSTWIYEKTNTPERTRTTYAYDEYGNVVEEKNYGALSIAGDELFTYTEYINDTGRWILGLPKREHQTGADGAVVSETRSYYDGAPYAGLDFGSVEKGNLTRQEGWVEGDTFVNVTRAAFDSFGNVIGTRDGNGNLRTVDYDPVLHTFPVTETIHVGGTSPDLTITAEYNLGFGTVTQSTDVNGNTTYYDYDIFGRPVKVVRPGDSLILPTRSYTYTAVDPERNLIYLYDEDGTLTLTSGDAKASSVTTRARENFGLPDTFDSITYTDGLGRTLALIEEAEEGFVVKNGVLLNARGTNRYSFLPYEASSPEYTRPPLTHYKTETHYDAAGRGVLRINPPDQNGTVTQVSTQYLPLTKTVTDENTNSKTFIYDGMERLTEVHETNDGEPYITRYGYDPPGNLIQITDAQNNVKTFEYDGLNRRIVLNDPDRGRMVYEYDATGNLIETTDNKGQVILYTYDGANRPLTEDYLDGADITPDAAYHYDSPSDDYPEATNVGGSVSWVEDLSGTQFFSYDSRGNTLWSVKRINNGTSYADYTTAFLYDATDRVKEATYPDGDRLQNTYNNRSLLESIPGVVEGIDYHASGQLASISYANGTETTYAYDPRQRLIGLDTVSGLQANEKIQDISYTMDGVSNITAITDGRPLPPGSPKNASQVFHYDTLYRLMQVEGAGYGLISFQYDKIGNMTWKKSPDAPEPQHIDDTLINLGLMYYGGSGGSSNRSEKLPGDPPGPHALTGTESGLAYDYDDNGNIIDANDDIYSWDFKDRLVRVQKGATDSRYEYDYAGQRVIKRVNDELVEKTTLYISNACEIRDGIQTKYVFAGDRRVARIEGKIPDPGGRTTHTLIVYPGWNYFSLMVEPEDPAIGAVLDSVEDQVNEIWTFDPLTGTYRGYVPEEGVFDLTEIHAQKGYIVNVASRVTLAVTGTVMKSGIPLKAGDNLIGCPSNAGLLIEEALASIEGQFESVWSFDNSSKKWQHFNPGIPSFLNDLKSIEPGKAYRVKMNADAELAYVDEPTQSIYFYHPDHLGSSNLVTDVNGAVVESTEFYPYGRPRHEERAGFDSAYKYTGKELDKESGLQYFGARYYDAVAGIFVSVDPTGDNIPKDWLSDPQLSNLYAYARNNPFTYIDPDGNDPEGKENTIIVIGGDMVEYVEHVKNSYSRRHQGVKLVSFQPGIFSGNRLSVLNELNKLYPETMKKDYEKALKTVIDENVNWLEDKIEKGYSIIDLEKASKDVQERIFYETEQKVISEALKTEKLTNERYIKKEKGDGAWLFKIDSFIDKFKKASGSATSETHTRETEDDT